MCRKLLLSLALLCLFCFSGYSVVVLSDEEAQVVMQNLDQAEKENEQLKEKSKQQQEIIQQQALSMQEKLNEVQRAHESALQQQKIYYEKQLKEAKKGKFHSFFLGTLTGSIIVMGGFILLF